MMIYEKKTTSRGGTTLVLASFAALLGGCDFSVTNPGPVDDTFLNDPAAFASIVNGIPRQISGALNWIAVDVAVRTRELHATQANEYVGVYIESHLGTVNPSFDAGWTPASDARWTGDDAIERMTEVLGDEASENAHVAEANLWTAYAYRLMGEYFCEVTVDAGPAMPAAVFLETAVDRFSAAIDIGAAAGSSDLVTAARAGRASVLVDLGRWDEALADAQQVPTSFSWTLPYYRQGDWRYYNAVHWYSADEPYRSLSVWNTPYETYYLETGDPRTPWQDHPDEPFGTGSLQPWGPVPWYTQEKYPSPESSIELSSGEEMRLIEAEAALLGGDADAAMSIINDVRAGVGIDPWPAPATLEEAWSLLKRERGIALWLEGRRLGDLHRWAQNDAPGELAREELGLTEDGPSLAGMATCVGIPNSERDANPNLDSL
ncbi:MAG: RagB/SusD family nutrient uptake outer membrane protein [Gemmatimonas sp.]|nr:RagB/SusD family nutrient uptake outer membrane protein [Gemmatimonas sp.]